jgi:hypothetical protein
MIKLNKTRNNKFIFLFFCQNKTPNTKFKNKMLTSSDFVTQPTTATDAVLVALLLTYFIGYIKVCFNFFNDIKKYYSNQKTPTRVAPLSSAATANPLSTGVSATATPLSTGLFGNSKAFSPSFVVSANKAGENGVVDLCSSVVAGSNAFSPALSVAAAQEEVKFSYVDGKKRRLCGNFFLFFFTLNSFA